MILKNTGTGKTILLDDPDYLGLPPVPTEQRLTEVNNKKDKVKKRKRQEDEEDLKEKKTRDTGAFTRITKFVETLGPAITSVNTREDLTHRYVQIQMSLAEDLQKNGQVSTFLTMLLKSNLTRFVNVSYTPTHRNIQIRLYK